MRIPRLFVPLLLASLVACGFRLQGTSTLPPAMAVTWIQWPADVSPDLQRQLPRALLATGIRLATAPEEATAVLEITEDRFGERVLSVSATNIPEELEVYHSVTFELRAGESVLFPSERITLTRDYTFDETAVLAKYQEGEIIASALVNAVVQQIRRRLAVLNQAAR